MWLISSVLLFFWYQIDFVTHLEFRVDSPERDCTLTRHLDINDIKTPHDHNEHGEHFEKSQFYPFLKIVVPMVNETRVVGPRFIIEIRPGSITCHWNWVRVQFKWWGEFANVKTATNFMTSLLLLSFSNKLSFQSLRECSSITSGSFPWFWTPHPSLCQHCQRKP